MTPLARRRRYFFRLRRNPPSDRSVTVTRTSEPSEKISTRPVPRRRAAPVSHLFYSPSTNFYLGRPTRPVAPRRQERSNPTHGCRPFSGYVTRHASCARGAAMSLYAHYAALLDEVLDALEAEGALPPGLNRKPVAVEPPRDAAHGDLATNAAMVLAKGAGTNPRALAELIAPKLEALPDVTEVERRRAGVHQPAAGRRRLAARAGDDPRRGRALRPLERRRGRAGQRRICLGQSDRADAHGPLPRRGGRRCARQPARSGRASP